MYYIFELSAGISHAMYFVLLKIERVIIISNFLYVNHKKERTVKSTVSTISVYVKRAFNFRIFLSWSFL